MSDAQIIASARETELRALFVHLHKALASGEALAAENFARGATLLGEAQGLALKALAQSARAVK
jgi:hypothetical protein